MNFHKVNLHQLLYQFGFLAAIFALNLTSAFPQTPGLPILTSVQVKATVTQQDSGIYEYRYAVQNLAESQAELWSIDIDITYPPSAQILPEEGLNNGPGYAAETSRVGPLLFPDTPKMIPIGQWSPKDWVSGLGRDGTAGWGSSDHTKIKPGETLEGYMIMSYGLPGIRVFRSLPWIDVDALYPSPQTQSELDDLIKQMDTDKEFAAFKGQTLGPTAPPADFVALDFIDYLEDLKHQALELGWITNEGIVNSLDVKLDQARKKLQAGNSKAAANVLEAFLNEVSAQGCESYDDCPEGKHLSPEAWALLFFNGQYLLNQL